MLDGGGLGTVALDDATAAAVEEAGGAFFLPGVVS